ncbi:Fc.00g101990.m01.CDS01 [Cosmosporella sp. VM-42]
MRFSTFLATASVLTGTASAAPQCGCSKPIVRKEWRTLSTNEKHQYINAVKCLAGKPSQTGGIYQGAKSRFDDFQGTHITFTDYIHFVGFFQAWHRVFVAQYEKDLRGLCGYQGAQPYWNWALDTNSAADFANSPIFDEVTGFGRNGAYIDTSSWANVSLHIPGKTGGGCVTGGPFVKNKWSVNMGPGPSTAYNPHCLRRDLAPSFAITKLNQGVADWTLAAPNFYEFDIRVEGGITVPELHYHGGGHLGVGGDIGEVGNVYSSPGDPIFFMHHANMDRLWNKWQHLDWPARRSDIGGPDTQFAYPYNFFGDKPYQNITLEYQMDFQKLIPGKQYIKVRDVMDIQGGELCYTYA